MFDVPPPVSKTTDPAHPSVRFAPVSRRAYIRSSKIIMSLRWPAYLGRPACVDVGAAFSAVFTPALLVDRGPWVPPLAMPCFKRMIPIPGRAAVSHDHLHSVVFEASVPDTPSQTDVALQHYVLLCHEPGIEWLDSTGRRHDAPPVFLQREIRFFKQGECWLDLPGLARPVWHNPDPRT
jgi:hypothetical protein